MSASRSDGRAAGAAMVLAGGACLSLAGIVLRSIEAADGWQILFYRALSFTVTLAGFLAARHRTRVVAVFVAVGGRGLAVALLLGVGSVFYVYAVLLTTVANALFVIASAPFFTALLSRSLLGERVSGPTWVAMTLAFSGVGLMLADGLGGGGLLGVLAAFGVATTQAGMYVVLRGARRLDMVPAICLSGPITAAIAFVAADGLAISLHDLLLCVFLGTAQFGAGFLLITLGTRRLPAPEVALLALSETVLAPLWVWIGADEVPSLLTVAGGVLVLGAVVGRALWMARPAPARP